MHGATRNICYFTNIQQHEGRITISCNVCKWVSAIYTVPAGILDYLTSAVAKVNSQTAPLNHE